MQQIFETMPLDLQHKICEKIVYPQPKELLDELREVLVNRALMRLFNQGKCPKLIPVMSDVHAEMRKIPGFVEKFAEQNEANRENDARVLNQENERKLAIRSKFV